MKRAAYHLCVLLLILSPAPLRAAVVYSGEQNIQFEFFAPASTAIDLDGDGSDDFQFQPHFYGGLMVGLHPSNQIVSLDWYFEPDLDVARLSHDIVISATSPSIGVAPDWHRWETSSLFRQHPPQGAQSFLWKQGEEAVLGIRFVKDPGGSATIHYGWIRMIPYLRLLDPNRPPLYDHEGSVLEWAHESVPDTSVMSPGAPPPVVPGVSPAFLAATLAGVAILARHAPWLRGRVI